MGYKALKVLVFIGCFSFQGIAQSIPIQLMVVDSDGFEKVNHAVKLRLTLTNDTSNTTGQYQEVHLTQSNDFGIVSESLGGGVVTTNSSVYALSEFAFNTTEPIINIELDTTALFNQYYTVGTLAYAYPLVSRRALRSDSSDYSSLSLDAEYADTAEYARNFDESLDNDTSSQNEIQLLDYNEQDKTITISKGNSIEIGSNSFLEMEGSLLSVPNDSNWYASQWIAADSLYIYSRLNSTQLKKALISNPDSVISVINVGFPIEAVFPEDSLVVGVNRTYPVYSVYACGLDGSNSISKSIGATADRIRSDGWSAKGRNVSYISSPTYGSSSSSFHSWLWALDSNTVLGQDFNAGFSNDFVFKKYVVSNSYELRFINRLSLTVSNSIDWYNSGSYYDNFYPDTSSMKYVQKSNYYSSQGFTYYDSLVSYGSFNPRNGNIAYYEIDGGYAVVKSTDSYFKQLYFINVNNIGVESSFSNLILDDWEKHPESSGSDPHIIKGSGEILVIFSDIKKFWIDGAYRSGSFIYRVPLN